MRLNLASPRTNANHDSIWMIEGFLETTVIEAAGRRHLPWHQDILGTILTADRGRQEIGHQTALTTTGVVRLPM